MRVLSFPYGIFQANMYVLVFHDEAIIIDPCVEWSQTSLKDLSVKAILCTHGHFDHIQYADKLSDQFKCPVLIAKEDQPMLADPDLNHSSDMGMAISVSAVSNTFKVCDYHSLDLGITKEEFSMSVIRTPGHTSGSVCFQFSFLDELKSVMFTGDTLFAGSVGRTDLGGNEEDMFHSIQLLKSFCDDIICYPGHGRDTVLGIEKTVNPFFK